MRPALGVLLLFVTSLEAQQASASGVVIDKSTGQPLRGVHVRMITGDFGGDGNGLNAVYGATSDATGHFSSENMPAGLYVVMGEKSGFLQLASSPQSPLAFGTLTLKAGQHDTDFKLEMTPHAVIQGRVVDEYGDPVFHASVELQPVPPAVRQESFGGSALCRNVLPQRGHRGCRVGGGRWSGAGPCGHGDPHAAFDRGPGANFHN